MIFILAPPAANEAIAASAIANAPAIIASCIIRPPVEIALQSIISQLTIVSLQMASNGRKIREQILALLARKDYRPPDKTDTLANWRSAPKSGVRMGLNQALRELERAGEIARIRKNRYVLPAAADLVTGKLSIHQAGYGFLHQEKPGEPDIFIAAENTGQPCMATAWLRASRAMRPTDRIKGRREGRVIRILERATRYDRRDTATFAQLFITLFPMIRGLCTTSYVHPRARSAAGQPRTVGDKVVVRLEPWESRHVNPEGEIIEVLRAGLQHQASICSRSSGNIICLTEFPRTFWIRRIGFRKNRCTPTRGREDLRKEFIVTIDPDDARDFDDAIHVEKNRQRRLASRRAHCRCRRLRRTPRARSIARRAGRGNSVYLPDRVISDVAGATEQRRLQSQPGSRSAHTFSLYPVSIRMELRKARALTRA